MRLHVVWVSEKSVVLPWNYLHLLHGFFYAAIKKANPKLGGFLHEQGFVVDGHRYKLATFSLLFPRSAKQVKNGLEMTPPIHWWVASPLPELVEALARTLLIEGQARLGKITLTVDRVEVEELPQIGKRCLFQTISPLVVSTGVRRGGKLERTFLSPTDENFWRVLETNLKRKAKVLGLEVSSNSLNFEPIGKWRSKLFEVQGSKVKGWEGKFWAEGDAGLLIVGYEAGFGERNAQGFGMVKLVKSSAG